MDAILVQPRVPDFFSLQRSDSVKLVSMGSASTAPYYQDVGEREAMQTPLVDFNCTKVFFRGGYPALEHEVVFLENKQYIPISSFRSKSGLKRRSRLDGYKQESIGAADRCLQQWSSRGGQAPARKGSRLDSRERGRIDTIIQDPFPVRVDHLPRGTAQTEESLQDHNGQWGPGAPL